MLGAFAEGEPEEAPAPELAETPADAQQPDVATTQAVRSQPATASVCQDRAVPAEDTVPVEAAPEAVAAAAPVAPPRPEQAAAEAVAAATPADAQQPDVATTQAVRSQRATTSVCQDGDPAEDIVPVEAAPEAVAAAAPVAPPKPEQAAAEPVGSRTRGTFNACGCSQDSAPGSCSPPLCIPHQPAVNSASVLFHTAWQAACWPQGGCGQTADASAQLMQVTQQAVVTTPAVNCKRFFWDPWTGARAPSLAAGCPRPPHRSMWLQPACCLPSLPLCPSTGRSPVLVSSPRASMCLC